jgi:hypothetical protein
MTLDPNDPNDERLFRDILSGSFPAWLLDLFLCRGAFLSRFDGRRQVFYRLILRLLDLGLIVGGGFLTATLIPNDLAWPFFRSLGFGLIAGYVIARIWLTRL